jgi:hypothetical protein
MAVSLHATPPVINLLSADAAFGRVLSAEDAATARRLVRLPRLDLLRGRWFPEPGRWAPPTVGALVVEGMLAHNVALDGRASTELLGPGDVFTPWRPGGDGAVGTVDWVAHEPTTLAVLDRGFLAAGRRWPALMAISHARYARRVDRMAQRTAALQLARVEDRMLAILWQLTDRFGSVAPDGIVMRLPLTHRVLGQLVGAQRPTVSLALQILHEEGKLIRREDGSLLLVSASNGR